MLCWLESLISWAIMAPQLMYIREMHWEIPASLTYTDGNVCLPVLQDIPWSLEPGGFRIYDDACRKKEKKKRNQETEMPVSLTVLKVSQKKVVLKLSRGTFSCSFPDNYLINSDFC